MSRKRKSRENTSPERGATTEPTGSSSDNESRAPSKVALGVAVLGLGALVFVLVGTPKPPPPRARPAIGGTTDLDSWRNAPVQNVSYSAEKDYSVGPEDAPVTIVEFSDFECPYCREGSAELKQVFDRYPGKVRIVFRNYPLDTSCNPYMQRSGHLYACRAAVMARCAGAQGHFWEMHDAIFRVPKMSLAALDELPDKVGLSSAEFSACMADDAPMAALRSDIDEGKRLGVDGTPTIFVNGRKAPSSQADTLFSIIDHVLAPGSE